jgi:hypothetical protein
MLVLTVAPPCARMHTHTHTLTFTLHLPPCPHPPLCPAGFVSARTLPHQGLGSGFTSVRAGAAQWDFGGGGACAAGPGAGDDDEDGGLALAPQWTAVLQALATMHTRAQVVEATGDGGSGPSPSLGSEPLLAASREAVLVMGELAPWVATSPDLVGVRCFL